MPVRLACCSAAGSTLQPSCPTLGATILGRHTMAVSSNQKFSIPISILDAFGSTASSGSGSNWIVALSQSRSGALLSGNMRGALSSGHVVLQGLSIQAEPGSRLNLTMSAVPPPGSGDQVRATCGVTACHTLKPRCSAVHWNNLRELQLVHNVHDVVTARSLLARQLTQQLVPGDCNHRV